MKSPLTDKTKIKAKNTIEKLQKNKLSQSWTKKQFCGGSKNSFSLNNKTADGQ